MRMSRTAGRGTDVQDLVSAGSLGLIQAVESYEPSRGHAFSTYAVRRIQGSILDELRRWDNAPRSVRRKQRALQKAETGLRQRLGRNPRPAETAVELEVPVDDVIRWTDEVARVNMASLDEPMSHEGPATPHERVVGETADDIEERLNQEQEAELLAHCIGRLKERERRVLVLYHYEGMKLSEIAEVLGVTESRVSQIRRSALDILRSMLSCHGVERG